MHHDRALLNFLLAIILAPTVIVSCLKEQVTDCEAIRDDTITTKSPEDSIEIHPVFGRRLTNAYSLDIMQIAYDSLCVLYNLEPQTLPPTDVYVRFLPKDSTEYNFLCSNNLEPFDYPLDYENVPYDYYHDSSVPDTLMTWQYTTIPFGMGIPDSLTYEVIDTCFIPDSGIHPVYPGGASNRAPMKERIGNQTIESLLDELANQIAWQINYPQELDRGDISRDVFRSSGSNYPSGTISVKIDSSTIVGLKGVKIRVNNFVKVGIAYTDANGHYSINKPFSTNVYYQVLYNNIKPFSIYGTFVLITPCWKNLQWYSPSGLDVQIRPSDSHWLCSVVNNCVYDYYTLCQQDGRTPPINNLKVGALSWATTWDMSPMLHHLGYQNFTSYSSNEMGLALLQLFGLGVIESIVPGLKYGFCDVTIGDKSTYEEIDEVAYHELSHASHFAASGTSIWYPLMVFNVIAGSDGYGDGTVNDYIHRIGELSEAWGFANERIRYKHNRGSIGDAGYSFTWLQPSIKSLYELIDENVLTEKQILQRMTPTTTSIDILHSRLQQSYPDKAARIGFIFASHNALTWQTKWTLHNATGTTLNLVLRKGTYTREYNLYNNDSCLYLALPWDEESFYSIKNTYTDYYPDEITILNGVDTVFHEINRVPTHQMHSPLFYATDWTCQTTYTPVGDTHIREFSHTLYSL